MRKLTVKNFSVIKEAELEFGKFTVLIGPQSSGKSLLCKLAYFCIEIVPQIANDLMSNNRLLGDLNVSLQSEFKDWFPVTTWSGKAFLITWEQSSGAVSVIRCSGGLETLYFDFGTEFNAYFQHRSSTQSNIFQDKSEHASGPFYRSDASYVPTGRSFFTTPNKSIAALSAKNLGPVIERFAQEVDFDYRRLRGEAHPVSKAMAKFLEASNEILGGKVLSLDDRIVLQNSDDQRIIPFSLLSSGPLDLLPLLNVLSRMTGPGDFPSTFGQKAEGLAQWVFIEEPESCVFPKTQHLLMKLLSMLINTNEKLKVVITTHSPYIMTAFNTLIQAGRVGSLPGNREKVCSFIPEQYWIKEGDFKAYAMEDGKLVSIFKPESEDPEGQGMINGDYLDGVSDQLGKEFSRLLDIEFAK